MEKFETHLNNLEIPDIDDPLFKGDLRRELIRKFVKIERSYQIPFKLAAGFAGLLIIFVIGIITNPQLAYDLNAFIFNKEETVNIAEFQKIKEFANDFQNTTIYNPELSQQIDPAKYREDKTYIIRKYVSQSNESIMMVSEMKPDKDMSPTKITY